MKSLVMVLLGLLGFFAGTLYTAIPNVRHTIGRLQLENIVLKAEISEWQKVAIPVIRARGWQAKEGIFVPSDLKPEILKFALDPCFVTPAGNFIQSGPDCSDVESDDREAPPFKIVFD